MQISLELKDNGKKVARFQCEVENGKVEFSKLVNAATVAALAGPVEITIPKDAKVTKDILEEIKKPAQITTEVKPVISEEVVVHEQTDSNKESREVFLIVKCECGEVKAFKTKTYSGKDFVCKCGKRYTIEETVQVHSICPNCGYERKFNTLKGMDISEGVKCGKCESPIEHKYNEKAKEWQSL